MGSADKGIIKLQLHFLILVNISLNFAVQQAISYYYDTVSAPNTPSSQTPPNQAVLPAPPPPIEDDLIEEVRTSLLSSKGIRLPLRGINVKVLVKGLVAQVEVLQRYRNTEDSPVEAQYVLH